jgi:hypothetical protein
MATSFLKKRFDATKLPALKQEAYKQLIAVPAFKKGYAADGRKQDFLDQGFPPRMLSSFTAAADANQAVVSSRVPGGATTQLIEDRHDLKGYFIKAKSCNWGPMSGFLCRHPAFNKNGAGGIESNLASHYDYWKKYLVGKFNMNDTLTDFVKRAFVPLKITQNKATEFQKKALMATQLQGSTDTIYGLDTNAVLDKTTGVRDHSKATAVMEFLMKQDKTTQLWSLYYGKVYTRIPDDKKPPNYTQKEYLPTDYINAGLKKNPLTGEIDKPGVGINFSKQVADPEPDTAVQLNANALSELKKKLSDEFKIARPAGFNEWRTIDGIMNPNPPYEAGPNFYKNAVSGDYDLFATWPNIPVSGFRELVRISEEGPEDDPRIARKVEYINFEKLPLKDRYYLTPVAGKELSLEIRQSRNVYMEFIPGFESIDKLESSFYGNYNDAVFNVVGSLNTFVDLKYKNTNGLVAFHSDEGGRPGVNDIEYPVAFFLPQAFARWCGLNNALLIRSHAQFLALINFLKGWYFIPLNWGWFLHLFMMIHTPTELQTAIGSLTAEKQKGAKKYLEDRLKELNEKLPQGDQAKIIQSLKNLFVPMSQRSIVRTNPDTEKKLSPSKTKKNKRKMNKANTEESQNNELVFNALKTKFLEVAKGDISKPASGPELPPYLYWKLEFENLMQEKKTAPKNK